MILNFMNANKELKVNKIKNRQTEESKGMNLPFKLLNQFKVPRMQERIAIATKRNLKKKWCFIVYFFACFQQK